MKTMKHLHNILFHQAPTKLEKCHCKTIRTWRFITIEILDHSKYFFLIKRSFQPSGIFLRNSRKNNLIQKRSVDLILCLQLPIEMSNAPLNDPLIHSQLSIHHKPINSIASSMRICNTMKNFVLLSPSLRKRALDFYFQQISSNKVVFSSSP